uniref:Uncharacterized protein n=1 Tax=Anguilla anguilla TaxID=7936 RepID=A0A0E9XK11_ANGAN
MIMGKIRFRNRRTRYVIKN